MNYQKLRMSLSRLLGVILLLSVLSANGADEATVLTQEAAIAKAKAFYDTKGEWAGKFTITQVHQVRFEALNPNTVTAHIRYQAGFLKDLSRTVEDQRTFGFQYHNGWQVIWMGGHKSARF